MTTATRADQRTTRRFNLKLPLTVKMEPAAEGAQAVQTKDVSARGVFFYIDKDVSEGSPIEFTLTLPPEITLTESIRVRCSGKVVRVERPGGKQIGIAAQIEQYDFVAE
jgi:hypothetical protein